MRHPVIKASHTQKVGDFHLYSNTSDDALGLSGALADIGSTLSQAKQAILITGWKFSPELHLLFFHEQLREALIAHEKKELDQAEEQYHAVTEHFSETSLEYCYAHYFLAVIQMETGRLDEAEASLKRCLAVQPHNPQFFNAQLAILLTQGKLAEAEEKAMLQANTPYTNANFFALYGDILAKNINSYRGAEENYLRALEQDSACILALRGLGKLYALQGKTKEAIEKFSFLLKFFPADPDANLQLAKI